RYFPDPDLPPLELDEAFIEAVRQTLPELPDAKRARFKRDYKLNDYDVGVLTTAPEAADFYEATATASGSFKLSANWITGELAGRLKEENRSIVDSPVTAEMLAGLIQRIEDNTISGKIAKDVFDAMWQGEGVADEVIEKRGLKQITDVGEIEKTIDQILAVSSTQVGQYRNGQEKVFGYFVGQVMKATGGKANPKQVNEILKKKLKD
ncbi:MAG: Asp-tRNA(Asn)/Glu-tRNA(Gln) amidotransferase GatCAB subunit B, partial [Acidiferrobacterales bacterium]